jgi:hypothetical protein
MSDLSLYPRGLRYQSDRLPAEEMFGSSETQVGPGAVILLPSLGTFYFSASKAFRDQGLDLTELLDFDATGLW